MQLNSHAPAPLSLFRKRLVPAAIAALLVAACAQLPISGAPRPTTPSTKTPSTKATPPKASPAQKPIAKTPSSSANPRPLSAPSAASQPAPHLLQADTSPGELAIVDAGGNTTAVCPLKHTDVQADISGFVGRVNVRQEFENPSKTPVEAIYTFPLPADAAVDDMTMTIGKRIVKGEIKRREEARAIYEAARNAGQTASLLDQERPNIFTQSIANIMPGEKITIQISYVNVLKYEEGGYEFSFPMVVGPRYTPTGGYSVPGQRGAPSDPKNTPSGTNAIVTDADKITPPITPAGTRAGHNISLTVHVDAGVPIQNIESVLHAVTISRSGDSHADVSLKNEVEIPNRDFILKYTTAGKELQTALLTHADREGDGYFTLIFQPPLSPPQADVAPKEMVFVIDQTGSQGGFPIAKSKETMRYCIKKLNPGDTFQLIGFNTAVYPCFAKPVEATPENIATALKFLEPLQGSGGTDILKSVQYALQLPDDPKRLRIVCYMTDGFVGNDMQIIDYIRNNAGRARMFPFGIGNSVNRFLIDGMAREGRGIAEYVTLGQGGDVANAAWDTDAATPADPSKRVNSMASGQNAAQRFYQRIAQPVLLSPTVNWNGLPVADVYPNAIRDVFTSSPIVLKGRYTRGTEGDITVSGVLRGRQWSQKLHVKFPSVEHEGAALPSLWAREKIETLQSQDWLGAQSGQPKPAIKEQIIAVALEYRLMSQYTSFVAVEQQVVNIGGQQRTIDVPIEMPEGVSYDGTFAQVPVGRGIGGNFRAKNGVGGIMGLNGLVTLAGAAGASGPVGPQGPAGPPAPASTTTGIGGQVGAASPAPRLATTPAISHTFGAANYTGATDESTQIGQGLLYDNDIATGNEAGQKKLDAMKPEDRHKLLAGIKIAPALQGLAEKLKTDGKDGTLHGAVEVEKGQVTVQIWLNTLPPDGLAQLAKLGFKSLAVLTPNKLLLGTVPVEKLDALVELGFVRYIEPPKFK